MKKGCGLAFAAMLACGGVQAATFSVGTDPACTHADLPSAIGAAASNGVADVVVLARPWFDAVEILIDGDQLTLRGGYGSCDSAAPTGRTELRGRDDPASRVLTLRNQGTQRPVELFDLDIVRTSGTRGGGILMDGLEAVELRLVRTTVSGHEAERGAGVDMHGPLSAPKLLKLNDSEIYDNVAETGGGIYCDPGSVEIASGSRVRDNSAQYGGGIAGRYCQVQVIGDSSTELRGNTASVHGGAAYLAGHGQFNAARAPGATSGPIVADNVAGGSGGAVYLSSGQGAGFSDTVVRGNRAGDSGGVVYGVSSQVGFSRQPKACSLLDCGLVADNHAGLNPVTEGRGGVVALVGQGGYFEFHRQVVMDNSARQGALGSCECGTVLGASNSLMARNSGAAELFSLDLGSELRLIGSTVTDNSDLRGLANARTTTVWVDGSILTDPVPLIAPGAVNATTTIATCSVLDPATPPANDERDVARIAEPGFVAAPLGDYSLREDAPTIDFCGWPRLGDVVDLPGQARGVLFRSNPSTRFDAGAFERHPLFADGFE
jgi:hypothetical protein